MTEERKIQIKSSYIHIDSGVRLFIGLFAFLVSFSLLFILMVLAFGSGSSLLFYLGIPISLVFGAVCFVIIFYSEHLLKKRTETWDFTKFLRLQLNSVIALSATIVLEPTLVFYIWLNPLLRLNLFIVFLVGSLVLLFAIPFSNFYTPQGRAILDYSVFMEDFKMNPENADFSLIRSATLTISKIARKNNIEIEPYRLSLGLSVEFLQNIKTAEKDVTQLIKWIENPRENGNFVNFKNVVKKYAEFSDALAKEGITTIHRWSFEQKTAIISLIAVPSVVAILTVVIPELVTILHL